MDTDLQHDGAFWDLLGETDPLWAILSDPARRGRRWDLATFFGTGEREISTLMHQLSSLLKGQSFPRESALDFGCGVGRLSQALARYFETVVGIDVSARMLAHANRLNRHPDRVRYLLNDQPHLRVVAGQCFDLIYSDLVLQHMAPSQSLAYVGEFLRVLRPGGVMVFQLPSHKRSELAPELTPMPDAAYGAAIEVVTAPAEWRPGSTVRLTISITNTGTDSWDQRRYGALRLGNHWLTEAGEMVLQDDGRAWLPEVLAPGEEAVTVLEVRVPDTPGRMVLELDVVHEGYSWFVDKGSRSARLTITTDPSLQRDAAASASPACELSPWDDGLLTPYLQAATETDVAFPMFGVPRDDLVAFVTARGAALMLAEPDDRGGREWEGFRYFFRKVN